MIKPECIDPKEVLQILNNLGYTNITRQQFKDFLHDLKKLIKYEQKHELEKETSKSISSEKPVKYDQKNDLEKETSKSICCENCSCADNSAKYSSDESYQSFASAESASSVAYSEESNSNKTDEYNKRTPRSVIDTDRVPASFIRPWNITVQNNLFKRSRRNPDPVKLYHQYKECWNKLGVPGESKHSELRWMIRSKMLGQDPTPYPRSPI